MPRIQTLRKCHRKEWNGAVDTPAPHRPCGHGSEEFLTMNWNALDFERSTVSQTLVPFLAHDIRHHLASIYCNIEFMSDPDIGQTDAQKCAERSTI
jgi:hypothetical protein